MGLDMYLEKMPRYKNVTARMVSIMESYFNLEEAKIENPKYIDCTLEKWCGADETELPDRDILEYFKQFYKVRYFPWDIEHSYGHKMIIERVGYWRKANQIHNWFVNRVQDGIDDCEYHHECTKEILEELLARIRVMVRKNSSHKTSVIKIDDLTVNTANRSVSRAGKPIILSAKEYELLRYLAINSGIVLSREKIENHIWNFDYEGGTNVVDVYIRYLRKKLDDGFDRKLIHTVRGAGYMLK